MLGGFARFDGALFRLFAIRFEFLVLAVGAAVSTKTLGVRWLLGSDGCGGGDGHAVRLIQSAALEVVDVPAFAFQRHARLFEVVQRDARFVITICTSLTPIM